MSDVEKLLKEKGIELPLKLLKDIESKLDDGTLKAKNLEKVIERVSLLYEMAKVEPGEGVGVLAAQSIGEPGTQMMMRTKHYAGTAMDVTRGLPRLIEIFDARRSPKTPMMTIYLDNEHNTLEKAEKIAYSLKETKIKHVVKSIETNFAKFEIVLVLDKHELIRRGITPKKLDTAIKEKFKKNAVRIKDRVIIKPLKRVASTLQKLREDVQETNLSGVRGISYVVIQKEDRDYVIYTKGTNLVDVLKVKGIDSKRTISNDVMEIERIFGIEAVRNALIHEIIGTLKDSGLIVDPRHVTLVADTMCADGIVKAIGRHGVSGDKASVLARASFEETVKHLLKAGAYGEEDALNGVVENIIVGQVISLGTGIPELILKREK